MKISVAGTGYVGMSIATLLAQHNEVTSVDIVPERVEMVNNRKSPIQDDYIERFFREDLALQKGESKPDFILQKPLNLKATLDWENGYKDADFVVIAAPTNYDTQKNFFDTSAVEDVIEKVLKVNPTATMVIKSTIPVGYTRGLYLRYANKGLKRFNLLFGPEFLRESKALYDNLYPSRIIVGYPKIINRPEFEEENKGIPCLFMGMKEAEAVKLFANTYLALRVSYFNELDTYAEVKGLDTQAIISGVGLDPRIGTHYNNPSFGYGGYCQPEFSHQNQ